MSKRVISPDPEKGLNLLKHLWNDIIREDMVSCKDQNIITLINSNSVSIRYCLPTQLLGKLIDHSLDCLCLQKGDGKNKKAWDPRSFCNKTIVQWISENQNILGTSTDPYVSKPLRKPRLEPLPGNVKGTEEWTLLYGILLEVESKNNPTYTKQVLIDTLKCIKMKFSELVFEYLIPERISLEQTIGIISDFLAESSGGDRGLSVAAAIFETFGKFFNLYSSVKRYVINAADKATGTVADIECYGIDGTLKLAIEVKERNLTLTDIKSAINKARRVSLHELLFNVPGSNIAEESEIKETIAKTWAFGTNIYRLNIEELLKVGLSLTGEEGRIFFLERVGIQLDSYNTQPINRKRWKELLENL